MEEIDCSQGRFPRKAIRPKRESPGIFLPPAAPKTSLDMTDFSFRLRQAYAPLGFHSGQLTSSLIVHGDCSTPAWVNTSRIAR